MIFFLAFIFNIITTIRNFLYDNKLLSIKSINIPIISVGNIELGGTGKTPTVLYLANLLISRGFKPGIISRGYKRTSRGRQIVCDGSNVLLNHYKAGDEPFFLATSLKQVPLIVDKNRFSGSEYMVNNFDVDIIILDDAFQHRKIKRTIDIVLLNINTSPDCLHLFPRGVLRENIQNIKRADILLITKQTNFSNTDNINYYNKILFENKFFSETKFSLINPINKTNSFSNEINKNVFVFCGIGDSNSFKNIIKSFNVNVSVFKAYKDHQDYNKTILKEINIIISDYNITSLITTEKDFLKISEFFKNKIPIYILKMNFNLNDDFDELLINMI